MKVLNTLNATYAALIKTSAKFINVSAHAGHQEYKKERKYC